MGLFIHVSVIQVALLGGLVSHSDGLISSAVNGLQSLDLMDGKFFLSLSLHLLCDLVITS